MGSDGAIGIGGGGESVKSCGCRPPAMEIPEQLVARVDRGLGVWR